MSLAQWLAEFRALHEKAKRISLPPTELAAYRARRDELARALLAAQRLTLKPGEVPRQSLRVARALQADIEGPTFKERAVTVDFSSGGFAAILGPVPPRNEELACQLRLPGQDPVRGRVRIAGVKPLEGSTRVAFAFVGLSESERERLEQLVFDTVLEQLPAR